MEHLLYQQQQVRQKQQTVRYRYLLIAQAILIIMLLISVLKLIGNERTILVPVTGEDAYWVDKDTVSEHYLQQMTEQLLWLRLNAHPDNAEYQQQRFLNFVHPKFYSDLKQQFAQEIETIQQQQITLNFYPETMTVDNQRLQVEVGGQLKIQVAQGDVLAQFSQYQVQYQLKQGRLWVIRFERLQEIDDDDA